MSLSNPFIPFRKPLPSSLLDRRNFPIRVIGNPEKILGKKRYKKLKNCNQIIEFDKKGIVISDCDMWRETERFVYFK